MDYQDPEYPDLKPAPDVEVEGDDADQKAWTEDMAEASRAALAQAAALTQELAEWKPTAHEAYLARVADPTAGTKMDAAAKGRAIKAFAETGVKKIAASAAGVCQMTLLNHERDDEVFSDAMKEAKAEYCTRLQLGLFQRGYVGSPKPIVGRVDKDRDAIIGYELVRSDPIAMMMAKAFMPDTYNEKLQIEATVQAGVLVVGRSMTEEQWEAAYGGVRQIPSLPILDRVRKELEHK